MSADNGVYILATTNSETKEIEYRVAHAQAIDNLDYYEKSKPVEELQEYMKEVWGNSHVYKNEKIAVAKAAQIEERYPFTEYGICFIDMTDRSFPE